MTQPSATIQSFPVFENSSGEPHKCICLWAFHRGDTIETCSTKFVTFENLLCHYFEVHGLSLKPQIDFCQSCERIFDHYLEGVEHHVSHAICLEEKSWKSFREFKSRDIWVHNLFEKLKEVRKELLEHLLSSAFENL